MPVPGWAGPASEQAAAQHKTLTTEQTDVAKLQAKLDSLDAIAKVVARGGRQLLTLHTSGERAKAVVAVGDMDTAKHVAVFTPGFTTTADGDLRSNDDKMRKLQEQTRRISNQYGDHGEVATVTWMGYDAPQWADVLNPQSSLDGTG